MPRQNHRVPHIMKAVKSVSIPTSILIFDTETNQTPAGDNGEIMRNDLAFGWAIAYRMESGIRTRIQKCRFTTPEGFFTFLKSRLSKDRPLYVFAHNLAFDFTIVDGWHQLEPQGFEVGYAVLEASPFILQLNHEDGRCMLIDTYNYWKSSLADMGASIGMEKLIMPDKKATKKEWDTYCFRDVEILDIMITNLLEYLRANSLGSFGVSAASMAFSIYKTSFMDHEIYLHDRSKVLALERSCYSGGLVNNFIVGEVKNTRIYNLDVNSLYPHVMLGNLPHKLLENYTNITPKEFASRLKGNGGAAWVLMESKTDTYPHRYNGRLCEVRGRWAAYLCGDELDRAIRCEHAKHITFGAVYALAPIFKTYVEYLWNERQEAKKAGDKVRNLFAKLLMNSLYGRFGMHGRRYVEFTTEHLRLLYEQEGKELPKAYDRKGYLPPVSSLGTTWRPMGLSHSVKLRYIQGKLEIEHSTGEHAQSFTGVAAFVTANAREVLRSIIAVADASQVYYCDTDSVFVSERGYRNLERAGWINPDALGKLKLEGTADNATFYGPKDYVFGQVKKTKGIKKNALHTGDKTYVQDQFEGIKSVLARGGDAYIDVRKISKTLSRQYTKGTVLKSGRVEPFRLSEW